MKKIVMAVIGSSLFLAGYHFTRLQNAYAMAQTPQVSPAITATPLFTPLKTVPAFAFRSAKPF